ncbi:MAG: hypothetical protein ACXACA_02910 [Candidatus Ranarchaeia archaeon]|jgi:hypothetical protein
MATIRRNIKSIWDFSFGKSVIEVGDVFIHMDYDGNPWEHTKYEVMEVLNGWVKLKMFWEHDGQELSSIQYRELNCVRAFYDKVEKNG